MRTLKSLTVLATVLSIVLAGTAAASAGTDGVSDRTDVAVDRPTDRPIDRHADRPFGCDRDRASDRRSDCPVHDRPRPDNCVRDGDLVDRPIECRLDRIVDLPKWKRCYHWVLEHTDVRPSDNPRDWWRLCHRWWRRHRHAL